MVEVEAVLRTKHQVYLMVKVSTVVQMELQLVNPLMHCGEVAVEEQMVMLMISLQVGMAVLVLYS